MMLMHDFSQITKQWRAWRFIGSDGAEFCSEIGNMRQALGVGECAFIGKVIDANVPMAIIRDGDRVNTLRQGDQHGGWRVTSIQDSGLQLAHLASGTEARLALGARASPKPAQPTPSATDSQQESDSEGTRSNDR